MKEETERVLFLYPLPDGEEGKTDRVETVVKHGDEYLIRLDFVNEMLDSTGFRFKIVPRQFDKHQTKLDG